jgi:uncharacterized RDD family membrane protein YckC
VYVTGQRVGAYIIDSLLITLSFAVVGLLVGLIVYLTGGGSSEVIAGYGVGFGLYLSLLLVVPYYVFFEGLRGQTPGKMLLGIKVVREDTGGVPGFAAATIRALLRIVDFGIIGPLLGFILVLISQKRQRLGDISARTLVIRA